LGGSRYFHFQRWPISPKIDKTVRLPSHTLPLAIGLALTLAIILLPSFNPPPQRNVERDIGSLQQAECEYRGITSSFEELTRVYVLETYQEGKLVRWEASPSPQNPDTEALVTGIFTVEGANEPKPDVPAQIVELRNQAPPIIGVSWRYSTLASVRITAANDYAVDAIAVYRRTIDAFLARMMVVTAPAILYRGPGIDNPTVQNIDAGTVLLLEMPPEDSANWSYVRIPSTTVVGWIAEENLKALE
jgi:hypothetical protein